MSTETAPESVTVDELAGALAELGIRINGNAYFPDLARNIFGYVGRQRREPEPGYEAGEIYEDAAGHRYMRVGVAALPWLLVGKDGLVISRVEGVPARPLRRLVPEGSPLSDDEQALIHGDLSQLLDLLGLGSYARPQSPHEVFRQCLAEVGRRLKAHAGGISDLRQLAEGCRELAAEGADLDRNTTASAAYRTVARDILTSIGDEEAGQ
jgi:hypothetical protein